MTQTVLLTGISGFIAKHIAVKLLNAGFAVRGSVRTLARADEVSTAISPHADTSNLSFVALDLNSDDGWVEAMEGVTALIHTASPFPIEQPKNADDLIRPAVDGTLRALASARAAGVMRVVLTSSTVALTDPLHRGMMDETTWCDPHSAQTSAYAKSKTLAETAAWEFATQQGMYLTAINPGFVMGPPLDANFGSSISVIARLLRGKDPMLPNIGFAVVDVRDVARLHVAAMTSPAAAGRRFIAASAEPVSMEHFAGVLRAAGYSKVPSRKAPNVAIKLMSLVDRQAKGMLPSLGKKAAFDNQATFDVLDWKPTPMDTSITEMAAAL